MPMSFPELVHVWHSIPIGPNVVAVVASADFVCVRVLGCTAARGVPARLKSVVLTFCCRDVQATAHEFNYRCRGVL